MLTALAMGAAKTFDGRALRPADVRLLALAHLAVEHLVGLIKHVVRVLVAERMREIATVLQKRRDQRGAVPLRLVEVLAAGLVGFAQPAAFVQYWLHRDRRDFPDLNPLAQSLTGAEPL